MGGSRLEDGPNTPHKTWGAIRDRVDSSGWGRGAGQGMKIVVGCERGRQSAVPVSAHSVALLMETTTCSSLPPEILNLIVDHLHDDSTALKACCVVSRSWVPRTRRHLFANVEFYTLQRRVESWKTAFPNPSNSPAHHTRTLCIRDPPTLTAADTDAGGWISSFHNVTHLRLERIIWQGPRSPLVPFHGLSPTLRSLSLTSTSFEVFDFICSFPLLEDLALVLLATGYADAWTAPSTSPKLTGTLKLMPRAGGVRPVVRRLLAFPDGLHFAKIQVSCINEEDARSATNLVSRCSDTLETLFICGTPIGGFHLVSAIGQHLITNRGCRRFSGATSS